MIEQSENLKRLADRIARTDRYGLYTAILIGSGVSDNVPRLGDMVAQMRLMELGASIPNDEVVRWRDELFSSGRGRVTEYLYKFLDDREQAHKFYQWLDNKLRNTEPTEGHMALVHLSERARLITLSTNFDGLMHRALRRFYGPRLVFADNVDDLRDKALTPKTGTKRTLSYLIKLRGDAFHWRCNSVTCSGRDIFRWDLPDERPTSGIREDSDSIPATSPIRCPVCHNDRMEAMLILPNERSKVRHNRPMYELLSDRIFPVLRSIIIVGFSGLWDNDVVEFIRGARDSRKHFIDLYVVDPKPEPNRHPIYASFGTEENTFLMDASSFFQTLSSNLARAPVPKETLFECTRDPGNDPMMTDVEERWEENFPEQLSNLRRLWGLTNEEEAVISHFKNTLSRMHQLGLKSAIMRMEPKNHTRYEHLVGVLRILSCFLAYLLPEKIQYPEGKSCPSIGESLFLIRLSRSAALLHDIGHVPFAHLIEEVFDELGWAHGKEGRSFTHDYFTETKLQPKDIKKDLLKSLGVWEKPKEEHEEVLELFFRALRGQSGIGYLDVLMNGPIDSDKFDYVPRDFYWALKKKVMYSEFNPIDFVSSVFFDCCSGHIEISADPTQAIVLDEKAYSFILTMLRRRRELFEKLYVSRTSRLIESLAKRVIRLRILWDYRYNELEHWLTKGQDWPTDEPVHGITLDTKRTEWAIEQLEREILEEPLEMPEYQFLYSSIASLVSTCHINENLKRNLQDFRSVLSYFFGRSGTRKGVSYTEFFQFSEKLMLFQHQFTPRSRRDVVEVKRLLRDFEAKDYSILTDVAKLRPLIHEEHALVRRQLVWVGGTTGVKTLFDRVSEDALPTELGYQYMIRIFPFAPQLGAVRNAVESLSELLLRYGIHIDVRENDVSEACDQFTEYIRRGRKIEQKQ